MVQNKTKRHCMVSAVCFHIIDLCQGTDNRIVCMETAIQQPGSINHGIYSSYPVVIDEGGNISVVQVKIQISLIMTPLNI